MSGGEGHSLSWGGETSMGMTGTGGVAGGGEASSIFSSNFGGGCVGKEDLCEVDAVGSPRVRAIT